MRVSQTVTKIFCRRPNHLAIFDRMFWELRQGEVSLKMPFVRDQERRSEIHSSSAEDVRGGRTSGTIDGAASRPRLNQPFVLLRVVALASAWVCTAVATDFMT